MNTLPEVLYSERLVIREPRESELQELEAHIRSTTGLIGFKRDWKSNYSVNHMSNMLTCNGNDYSNTGVFKMLVIFERSNNRMIGICTVVAHDNVLNWAAPFEYDVVLFNGYRGFGFGTESTSIVLNSISQYCYDDSNLAIMMARVSPDNAPSIRTFSKSELEFKFVYPASVVDSYNHIYLRHMFGGYDNIKRVYDYRESSLKYDDELKHLKDEADNLLSHGMFIKAKEVCNSILTVSPEAAWQYHDRGICNYRLGLLTEAITDLNVALSIHPYLAISHAALGELFMDTNDYESSIKHYSLAISIDDSNSSWYYNRMLSYRKLGDFDSAIRDCRDMIRLGDKEGMEILNELVIGRNRR